MMLNFRAHSTPTNNYPSYWRFPSAVSTTTTSLKMIGCSNSNTPKLCLLKYWISYLPPSKNYTKVSLPKNNKSKIAFFRKKNSSSVFIPCIFFPWLQKLKLLKNTKILTNRLFRYQAQACSTQNWMRRSNWKRIRSQSLRKCSTNFMPKFRPLKGLTTDKTFERV